MPIAPRRVRSAPVLLLLLFLTSCASAEKRLEQGARLEERGRPAEAAARYIDALRRDPSLEEARLRLAEAGAAAVEASLRESAAAQAAGRPGEAAEELLRLDALLRDAASVGVQLSPGADYPARRRAALDRAIEGALARAGEERGRGAWGDALRRLERAGERWEPSPAQRERLEHAGTETHLAWAEAEAGRGRFRAAHQRAEQAARLAGRESPAAARARQLQAEYLRYGATRVAVLPVVAGQGAGSGLPHDFLPELNDALEERAWLRPPLFVEVAEPREVAREARYRGFTREAPDAWEAAALGRDLRARTVVVLEVDSVRRGETDVRTTRRSARTRAGVDTAYTVVQGREEVWARVAYTVVDTEARRIVDEGAVSGRAAEGFRRAAFAGDPESLRLTREERALFRRDADARTEGALARGLAGELAEGVAREVFEAVLRQVP